MAARTSGLGPKTLTAQTRSDPRQADSARPLSVARCSSCRLMAMLGAHRSTQRRQWSAKSYNVRVMLNAKVSRVPVQTSVCRWFRLVTVSCCAEELHR
jgi:hypothetical protein